MFLVVGWQDSTSSYLIPSLLFISKVHGMLCLHTRNFTIKKTLMKTFANVSNELSLILVTHFLGNKLPFLKH